MKISQMLLAPQVLKLQSEFLHLRDRVTEYPASEAVSDAVGVIESCIRKIEKIVDSLNTAKPGDVTLQVLYLNFRELKLKYRTTQRKYRRMDIMGKRTVKMAKTRTAMFETVAA